MARNANILSLRGTAIPVKRVNRDVVDALQGLMKEARAGQIAGLLYAAASPEGHSETNWVGNAPKSAMVAAATTLFGRILIANAAEDED